MNFKELKKWVGFKLLKCSNHLIPLDLSTYSTGVEYNPELFQEPLTLLLQLGAKIEALESQSEKFQYLNNLKNQIKLSIQESNQSITQLTQILNKILLFLNQYSNDLHKFKANLYHQKAVSRNHRSNEVVFNLTRRQVQAYILKRQIKRYKTVLAEKRNSLSNQIHQIETRTDQHFSESLAANS
jgi:hypothetical protein